jgi:RNA polymerase sigma-70 factor, ECF subfamily
MPPAKIAVGGKLFGGRDSLTIVQIIRGHDMSDERGRAEREAVERFVCQGTEETFRSLFDALYKRLFRYFLLRGTSIEGGEELAQDVLFAVYRQVRALRDPKSFYGWLFRIARNCLLQYRDKQQRDLSTVPFEAVEDMAGPNNSEECLQVRMELDACFLMMASDERQIMLLRYVEGLSYTEIATALDMPLGTVKWKIFHVRSKCAAMVRGLAGVEV